MLTSLTFSTGDVTGDSMSNLMYPNLNYEDLNVSLALCVSVRGFTPGFYNDNRE